ncbi:hypothetical protein Rs2_04654 [Raphanus sativus]|nr:hypothetical protein Rs2_04654 [Raphanus sativus]
MVTIRVRVLTNLNGGEVNSGQEADVNINNDAVLTPAEPEEATIAFALLHQHKKASHYGLPYNYRQACALLGCSLPRANSGSFYCCTGHEEICKTWSSRTGEAHVVYYGFIKSTSPYLEHVCTTSIILKSEGVDVGIPFMKPESVWNKAPWENNLLGRDYSLQEKTRLWLYFTTQEECFKHLENEARVDFKWYTNGRNKRLVDGVWVNVTLLTVHLTKEKEKKKTALTDVEKEVKEVLNYTWGCERARTVSKDT